MIGITCALYILLAIIPFELFVLLRMNADAKELITRAQKSMRVLASSELEDDEKERVVRRGAVEIFQNTIRFGGKLVLITLVVLLPLLWVKASFPLLWTTILANILRPATAATVTVVLVFYAWLRYMVLRLRRIDD